MSVLNLRGTPTPTPTAIERNMKIFKPPSGRDYKAEKRERDSTIDDSFYKLSLADVAQEQKRQTEQVKKMTSMRTGKMRAADLPKVANYNHTTLRIRFPDGYTLQGNFGAGETVHAVMGFVREKVDMRHGGDFELVIAGQGKLKDHNKTMRQCGFLLSAQLNFKWDSVTVERFKQAKVLEPYLKEQEKLKAETM